ncbi:MAG: hypothetical protein GQ574_12780 [Crocinitomix sp.]|nr:hypothetical protein [Crocinitomix sp.]
MAVFFDLFLGIIGVGITLMVFALILSSFSNKSKSSTFFLIFAISALLILVLTIIMIHDTLKN